VKVDVPVLDIVRRLSSLSWLVYFAALSLDHFRFSPYIRSFL